VRLGTEVVVIEKLQSDFAIEAWIRCAVDVGERAGAYVLDDVKRAPLRGKR
jgi:hypothetical protein